MDFNAKKNAVQLSVVCKFCIEIYFEMFKFEGKVLFMAPNHTLPITNVVHTNNKQTQHFMSCAILPTIKLLNDRPMQNIHPTIYK